MWSQLENTRIAWEARQWAEASSPTGWWSELLVTAGFTFPNKWGDETPSNQTAMQVCVPSRIGCTRVPICSNCLQICTFSHSGELDPSLSDCESGKEKNTSRWLSAELQGQSTADTARPRPVCLSVCLPSNYSITFELFLLCFGKMTQIFQKQGKQSCGSRS